MGRGWSDRNKYRELPKSPCNSFHGVVPLSSLHRLRGSSEVGCRVVRTGSGSEGGLKRGEGEKETTSVFTVLIS